MTLSDQDNADRKHDDADRAHNDDERAHGDKGLRHADDDRAHADSIYLGHALGRVEKILDILVPEVAATRADVRAVKDRLARGDKALDEIRDEQRDLVAGSDPVVRESYCNGRHAVGRDFGKWIVTTLVAAAAVVVAIAALMAH